MKNFLAQFKLVTHTVAGLIATGLTLYLTNDAVHQAVNNVIAPHKKLSAAVAALSGIALAYMNSKKGTQ